MWTRQHFLPCMPTWSSKALEIRESGRYARRTGALPFSHASQQHAFRRKHIESVTAEAMFQPSMSPRGHCTGVVHESRRAIYVGTLTLYGIWLHSLFTSFV